MLYKKGINGFFTRTFFEIVIAYKKALKDFFVICQNIKQRIAPSILHQDIYL